MEFATGETIDLRFKNPVGSRRVLRLQGIAKTVTKQRIESHFDLELRAAVMVRTPWLCHMLC